MTRADVFNFDTFRASNFLKLDPHSETERFVEVDVSHKKEELANRPISDHDSDRQLFDRDEVNIWNEKIVAALRGLPSVNPHTLTSTDGYTDSDEAPARRIVQMTCASAPSHLTERLMDEYFDAGPIQALLTQPEVTEIIINGAESIWCERRGRLEKIDDCFLSALTYRNFITRLGREAGVQASLDHPFADGLWRGCRVHLIIPPSSGTEALLTLRRHPENPWTFDRLLASSWAKPQEIAHLTEMITQRQNFLVVGATGSGKTSVLNACLAMLPKSERAIVIEDTSELHTPNLASAKLLTRRDPHANLREIDQSELLKQALRMRPDRLVMGEVRGGEAKDLLMAFATGHNGCMGTLHADSARQALLRLEMLIQLGAPQWNLQAVRTLILLSLKAVVVVGKKSSGERVLEGIYRIASLEDMGFLVEKI